MSRFEINWSVGKIRPPRVSGRVLTYTLLIGVFHNEHFIGVYDGKYKGRNF